MLVEGTRVVDPGSEDVAGHQVGGELDAGVVQREGGGEATDEEGLRDAGDAFEQDVAVREEGDEAGLHHGVLPGDRLRDLGAQERGDFGDGGHREIVAPSPQRDHVGSKKRPSQFTQQPPRPL